MILLVLVAFCVLLALGIPVAYSMAIASVSVIAMDPSLPATIIGQKIFTSLDSFSFIAIPLFMLAGALMTASGNPLQAEDYGIRSLSACILGGLGFGGWGDVACAVFGSGFYVLIQNSVYYFFSLLVDLIPGFSVTSYWQNFVSDIIIFLGLLMTIVTAKGQRDALREGIVRQFRRSDRHYDEPVETKKGGDGNA